MIVLDWQRATEHKEARTPKGVVTVAKSPCAHRRCSCQANDQPLRGFSLAEPPSERYKAALSVPAPKKSGCALLTSRRRQPVYEGLPRTGKHI